MNVWDIRVCIYIYDMYTCICQHHHDYYCCNLAYKSMRDTHQAIHSKSWKCGESRMLLVSRVAGFLKSVSLSAAMFGLHSSAKSRYLENLVYHLFRQLWLVLGVRLMEINSNWFSRYCKNAIHCIHYQ